MVSLQFLNNGGSWEDIKVTFQCKLTDGTPLNHEDVFKNGVVDCYIQGNKIKAQFYPKFTTQVGVPIKSGTRIELNRGIYPYSFTMFSMWGPGRHYGASRVWDRWYEPQETAENRHAGFDMFTYDDILDTNGNITSGKNIKNFAYNQWNPKGTTTETGQYHEPGISTSKARIGDYTFNGGGATGIGFNFPIYITFEINPIQEKKGNALYVSEYSIVNMADDADPDEMTTHASMQAYSNRAQ